MPKPHRGGLIEGYGLYVGGSPMNLDYTLSCSTAAIIAPLIKLEQLKPYQLLNKCYIDIEMMQHRSSSKEN